MVLRNSCLLSFLQNRLLLLILFNPVILSLFSPLSLASLPSPSYNVQ